MKIEAPTAIIYSAAIRLLLGALIAASSLVVSTTQALAADASGGAPRAGEPTSQQNINLTTFKNPQTGATDRVVIAPSSIEELKKFSPEALSKGDEALREQVKMQCSSKHSMIREVAQNIIPEAGAFYAGVAMSSQMQIRSDPAALQHFYQNNITNVMGHVSFGFFMVGSRMTTDALSMMGLAFDPCREIKRGRLAPTLAQKRFGYLMGPLSMTGGFLLSSLVNEFLSDQNIHLCARGNVVTLTGKELDERNAACSKAYADWVTTKKITKYVPDLLSMTATSLVQGYLINMPLGYVGKRAGSAIGSMAERAVISGESRALILRTISIAANFTPGGPILRFSVQALGAMVFVSINEYILPYIKFPWERYQQGTEITSNINAIYDDLDRVEKNGWVWVDKAPPKECLYEPTGVDYANGYVPPYYCGRKSVSIGVSVAQLNDAQKKWRETVLADAYLAHDHWKDYLTQFQNVYTDSVRFYDAVLGAINWKISNGGPDPITDKIYSKAPANGLDAAFFDHICNMNADQQKVFKTAVEFAAQALSDLKAKRMAVYESNEIDLLQKVYAGLKATDCSQSTDAIDIAATTAHDSGATNPTAPQQDQLSNVVRASQVRGAIDTINQVLNGTGRLAFNERSRAMSFGLIAVPVRENPFYMLRQMLGDSSETPEGSAYLTDVDSDNTVILQDMKNEHSSRLGYARTSTMSNYLLASMVCGPQIGQGAAVESRQFHQKKKSLFAKALGLFNIDFDLTNRITDSNSMIYVEYDDQDAKALMGGTYGVRADFRPPMIVKLAGADAGRKLCNEIHRAALQSNNGKYVDPTDPSFDVRSVEFDLSGQHIKGLLDVVKKFADPAIVGTDKGSYAFQNFWNQAVDPHVAKVIELFRQDFKHLVEKDFVPNFNRKDIKVYNGRNFEIGTASSLANQVRFNLILLGKSMFPKTDSTSSAENRANRKNFLTLSRTLQEHLSLQLALLSETQDATNAMNSIEQYAFKDSTDPAPSASTPARERMQKDFDANKSSILAILEAIKSAPNARSEASPDAAKTLEELGVAAAGGVEALVTEVDSYFGIIDTIHVDGKL